MAIVTEDFSVAMDSIEQMDKLRPREVTFPRKQSQPGAELDYTFPSPYFQFIALSMEPGACHPTITTSQELCTHRWLCALYVLWYDFKMNFSSSLKIFTLGIRGPWAPAEWLLQ